MRVNILKDAPSTLPDLLHARCQQSASALIGFLDADGEVTKTLSCSELYDNACRDALRLLSAGLQPGRDIVVTSFSDHESHIRLLWACCFGMPPFHGFLSASD